MTVTARAGTLGALLTTVAGAVTAVLATVTTATWPGTGVVATEQALVAVLLAAATAGSAWAATVLALGTVAAVRVAGHGGGDRHARGLRAAPGPGRPTRQVCVLLLTVAGAGCAPAAAVGATPVTAVAAAVDAAETAPGAGVDGPAAGPQQPGASLPARAAGGTDLQEERPGDPGLRAVPQPGWTPTPTPPAPRPVDAVGLVSTVSHEAPPDRVVVRRGDTLWDLAARHLGPQAGTADVAEEWPRWYAANIDVIGPDPDLILPGQELVVPAAGAAR